MYKKSKKILVALLVACLMLTQVLTASAATAGMVSTGSSVRLAGSDRYQTAIEISKAQWTTSDYAVLAYGEDFPDALAAAPLAKKYNAPILLTDKAALSSAVLGELQRLKVKTVFVIGGEGVVSPAVANAVVAAGMSVERLFGADRYATALAVANKMGTTDTVVVAYGENYPDALSISAIAAAKGWPILLTDKNSMDASVKAYIGTKKAYVVGGTGVVSDAVLNSLNGAVRLGGSDRYDTNKKVLEQFAADLNFLNIFLATGEGFADALAGSALAAQYASPVVLVGTSLPAGTSSFLAGKVSKDSDVIAFGGSAVVADSVVSAASALINGSQLSVSSVAATTSVVDDATAGQYLSFTINGGQKATVEELSAAGYSVKFNASADVFVGSNASTSGTGELINGLAVDTTFDYTVEIKKGDEVVVSDTQEVKIKDTAIVANEISNVKIVMDTDKDGNNMADADGKFAEITSGKIVKGEKVKISEVKGTTINGLTKVLDVDTVSNDNPFVADVVDNGTDFEITGLEVGTFTITVKSGNSSKDVKLEVVKDGRKAKTITTNVSSVKLAQGAVTEVEVLVKDQYGDVVPNFTETTSSYFKQDVTKTTDASKIIATVAAFTTAYKGKAKVAITANAETGNGTLYFYDKDGVKLTSVSVAIDSSAIAKTFKLEKRISTAETTIDKKVGATNNKLDIVLNKYSASGALLGPSNLMEVPATEDYKVDKPAAGNYGVYTESKDVVPQAWITTDGTIVTITADPTTGTKTGSARLVVRDAGGTFVASFSITVTDSAPVLSGITFESGIEAATTTLPLDSIIHGSGITFSGQGGDGKARTANDGSDIVIYIDADDDGTDTTWSGADKDILLGRMTVKVVESTGTTAIAGLAFDGNKDLTGFASGMKGKIAIGVTKRGASTPAYSVTVNVNVK